MSKRKQNVDLQTQQHLDAGLDPADLVYLKPDSQQIRNTTPTYVRGICIG